MLKPDRRLFLTGLAAAACTSQASFAQTVTLSMLTAPKGSAFLPYGEGLQRVFAKSGAVSLVVKETKGSTENIANVEMDVSSVGCAFLGSVYQAVKGIAPFLGKPHVNLRALFPMYDTSFQIATLTSSRLGNVAALSGKKVGVGPAGGPAEGYFKGLAAEIGLSVTLANGSADELSKALLTGEIDALWQGASIPIPAFVTLSKTAPITVFGLSETEVAATLKVFPFLTGSRTAQGVYSGQNSPILSVSAWNIVIANKDMPELLAYEMTKSILSATDLTTVIGLSAAATRAENAIVNTVLPYHPGAARYLKERGITVTSG